VRVNREMRAPHVVKVVGEVDRGESAAAGRGSRPTP
jgi:hypothetical protein